MYLNSEPCSTVILDCQARIAAKPDCFEKMLQLAESLAGLEPFLRVDLYDIGRPIFGEITLHPEAGLGKFNPPEWDEKLGAGI